MALAVVLIVPLHAHGRVEPALALELAEALGELPDVADHHDLVVASRGSMLARDLRTIDLDRLLIEVYQQASPKPRIQQVERLPVIVSSTIGIGPLALRVEHVR